MNFYYLYWAAALSSICLCITTYFRVKIILDELLLWVPFKGRRRRLWGVVTVIIPLLNVLSYCRWNLPRDLFWDMFGDAIISQIVTAVVALFAFLFRLIDGQMRREGVFAVQWLYTWDQLDYYTIDGDSAADFYEFKLHTLRRKWFSRKMRVVKWKFDALADLKRVTSVLEQHGVYQDEEREVSV